MGELDESYVEAIHDDLKMMETIGFVEHLGNLAIAMAYQPDVIKVSPEFWQLHQEYLEMSEEEKGKVFYHYTRLLVCIIEELLRLKHEGS